MVADSNFCSYCIFLFIAGDIHFGSIYILRIDLGCVLSQCYTPLNKCHDLELLFSSICVLYLSNEILSIRFGQGAAKYQRSKLLVKNKTASSAQAWARWYRFWLSQQFFFSTSNLPLIFLQPLD